MRFMLINISQALILISDAESGATALLAAASQPLPRRKSR